MTNLTGECWEVRNDTDCSVIDYRKTKQEADALRAEVESGDFDGNPRPAACYPTFFEEGE